MDTKMLNKKSTTPKRKPFNNTSVDRASSENEQPRFQSTAEKISELIQLSAANKITTKNAFSLQMIDFMMYMIKMRDKNMSNMQMATTSLDVSVKIYGSRVDYLYKEILRIQGVAVNDNGESDFQSNGTVDSMDAKQNNAKCTKRQNTRKKQQIFVSSESLKINVNTMKPSLLTRQTDVQTSNLFGQVTLPLHAKSGFCLHPYDDVIIDTLPEEEFSTSTNGSCVTRVGDFSRMEICPPFSNFDFLDCSTDSSSSTHMEDENGIEENSFQSRLEDMQCDSAPSTSQMDFNLCGQTETEKDLETTWKVSTDSRLLKRLQCTSIPRNSNLKPIGSSHGKVDAFRKCLLSTKIDACALRKPMDFELFYERDLKELVQRNWVLRREKESELSHVSLHGTKDKLLTHPIDKNYDTEQFHTSFLHPKSSYNPDLHEKCIEAMDCNGNSSIVNANDSFCGTDMNFDSSYAHTESSEMSPASDNFGSSPTSQKKLTISYTQRITKIDMGELEETIWGSLRTNANEKGSKAKIGEVINLTMSSGAIYKELPQKLGKNNAANLSFPIFYVSLLHLANEKALKIETLPDGSELIVICD